LSDQFRKNMALFPIGIVMKLTDLSARQIRYYEQNELISPERSSGNQRLFSFNDVTALLKIKELLEQGVPIAGIKQAMQPTVAERRMAGSVYDKKSELSDRQLHGMLRRQRIGAGKPGHVSLIQGELARFYY